MPRPRALCLIPHFFGQSEFRGGSTDTPNVAARRAIVERTIQHARRLESTLDIDVRVYGKNDSALVPVDVHVEGEPGHLIWQAFADARRHLAGYDYFLVIEDDLRVPGRMIRRMMAAERELGADEILYPNRIEFVAGLPLAVDLIYLPEWTGYRRGWRGRTWREAVNHNSGFCFMSRRQMERVCETEDFSIPRRGKLGYFMAGAFEAVHDRFHLLREPPLVPTHYVIHQDSWLRRTKAFSLRTAAGRQLRLALSEGPKGHGSS